ncbi:MAG TPA: alpha/beta fold hydrolase [Actinomycetota bacterium]|nr:alpha/beta fold hydrolase [Actinomycetota bacterium]
MSTHPVLVNTGHGLIGAIITEPDGNPRRAAAILFEGREGRRSGVNQVWTLTARELAGMGVTVLRLDYPGWGDSWAVPPGIPPGLPMREVIAWFRERVGDVDLLFIGACFGSRLAAAVATEVPNVVGLALVNPYVRIPPSKKFTARARRAVTRLAGRSPRERFDRSLKDVFRGAFRTVPSLAIVADGDGRTPAFMTMQRTLREEGVPLEVQTFSGAGNRTLGGQREGRERVVAWARSRLHELSPR